MSYLKTSDYVIYGLMCEVCTDSLPVDNIVDNGDSRSEIDTDAAKSGWRTVMHATLGNVSHYCSKKRCAEVATKNLSTVPMLRLIA